MADENIIDSLSIKIDGDASGAATQIEAIKKALEELKGIYASASSFSSDIGEKLSSLAKGVNAIAGIDANAVKSSTEAIKKLGKLDLTSIVTNFGNVNANVSENMENLAKAMSALASAPADMAGIKKSVKVVAELNITGLANNMSLIPNDIENKANTLINALNALSSFHYEGSITSVSKSIDMLAATNIRDFVNNVMFIPDTIGDKLTTLANGINILDTINADDGIKAVRAISSADIQGLITNIMLVPDNIADKFTALAGGLNSLSGVSDAGNIAAIAKGTRDLASIDFGKLSANISGLDDNSIDKVRRFSEGLSKLSGSFDIMDTIKAFTRLAQIDFTKFNTFADNAPQRFETLSKAILDFANSINSPEVEKAIHTLEKLNGIKLSGLANLKSIRVTVPNVKGAIEQESASAENAARNLRDRVTSFFDFSAGIKNITGSKIIKPFIGAFNIAGKAVKGYATGVKMAFTGLGKVASSLGQKLMVIPRSFMRIAKYRFIRSVIRQITQAFKEGIDNLYQYSKLIDGQFAKSMDNLATSALYFRNSIGAAVAPIINQLAPAIDTLVDKLVNAINKFNEFTARLTGASTWTKALKYPKEYAKATQDASETVEDAKKAVKDFQMGFDELNVISVSDDDPMSKLADATEDQLDYSKMFEEMQTTGNFIKSLNDLFDSIPWDRWGNEVGEGINSVIQRINDVLENTDFTKLGKGLATFFNSMNETVDWNAIGIAFANGLNSILDIWKGFIDNFKFAEFGVDIGDAINGFFEKVNFQEIGYNIGNTIKGILDTIGNTLGTIKWDVIGSGIATAFNSLIAELPSIGEKLATALYNLVHGSLVFVNSFLKTTDFKQLGANLFLTVKNFLMNVDWGQLARDIIELIGNAFTAITDFLGAFFGESLMNIFSDEDMEKITSALQPVADAVDWFFGALGISIENGTVDFDAFKENWVTGFNSLRETMEPVDNAIKLFFQSVGETIGGFVENWKLGFSTLEEFGGKVYDAINGIKEAHSGFDESAKHTGILTEAWENFKAKITGVSETTKASLSEYDAAVATSETDTQKATAGMSSAWSTWQSNFNSGMDTIVEGIAEFKGNWKSGFNDIVDSLAKFGTNVLNKATTIKTNVSKKFSEMKTSVVNVFSSIKTGIEEKLTDIGDTLRSWNGFEQFVLYIGTIPNAVKEHAENIKKSITDALSALPASIKGIVNEGIGYVEGLINRIIDGFNSIVGVFNKAFSWASKILGDDFGENQTTTQHVTLPRFDKGGFPNSASLFFANENGTAEMVGQIGNTTAVVNNDQIVEAVSDGVSVAVSYVMAEYIPQIISAIMQGKTIEIDGKELARTVNEANRTIGASVYSGGAV